jgi:hypothetical protein
MNTPKVQTEADDPKRTNANPDTSPLPGMPHGIPEDATKAQPKGYPNSDRHETETAPAEKQPGPG